MDFSIDKVVTASNQIQKFIDEINDNGISLTLTRVTVNFQNNSIWRKFRLEIPSKSKIGEKWEKFIAKVKNPLKIPKTYDVRVLYLLGDALFFPK